MDPNVPAGAAVLLDFIRKIETGKADASSYEVVFGHNESKLPKPLTTMTVDEVIAAGPSWTRAWRSSAAGGYQFMNATLKDLKRELGLRGTQVMNPNLQDRLAYHLLKRRGYEAFMAGRINAVEFGKRLAMEWASLPVLATTQGQHRQVNRGQSYYAGDGLNKALTKPEDVEAVIAYAKSVEMVPPQPAPQPAPAPSRPIPQPAPVPPVQGKDNGQAWPLVFAVLAAIAAVAIIVGVGA
ncbi:hypothetical protein EMQ25_05795 [Arsenicitalea aurantiaca]|uniref:Glycoside hydrolase family 104 protein n=1 Tax=Arsenicitalea aurantiaca TaxID=1783274 RepID=A0A433XFD3_9HYPH|nr:hypothetical protein [Arsenicitalea aurantiaca]RUT32658.1 hypothetical protein EMQ25_05795 [Arsenicitalea aurantiaca]